MEFMILEVRWDYNGGELIVIKKFFKNLFLKFEIIKGVLFLICGYVEKYVEKMFI